MWKRTFWIRAKLQLSSCLCTAIFYICLCTNKSAGLRMSKQNVLLQSGLCKSDQCKYEHTTLSVDCSDASHCSVEFSRSQPRAEGSSRTCSCRCDCSYDACSSEEGRKKQDKEKVSPSASFVCPHLAFWFEAASVLDAGSGAEGSEADQAQLDGQAAEAPGPDQHFKKKEDGIRWQQVSTAQPCCKKVVGLNPTLLFHVLPVSAWHVLTVRPAAKHVHIKLIWNWIPSYSWSPQTTMEQHCASWTQLNSAIFKKLFRIKHSSLKWCK